MKAYGLTKKGSRKLIRDGGDQPLVDTNLRRLRVEQMQHDERIVKLDIRIVGTVK